MHTLALGARWRAADLLAAASGALLRVELDRDARQRVQAARTAVERIAAGEAAVYGVNTGFGALARRRIAHADLGALQRNLLRSHAVGTGPPLSPEETRLALLLRIHSICQGYSGVRVEVVEWFLRLFQSGWLPRVPEQGSVGASGDLAPLAHLALPILGEGELVAPDGKALPARRGLARIGLAPLALAAKEGLALINGVQVSNAVGLCAWARARVLSATAEAAGSLSVEALMGSHRPFDARVVRVRPHPGAARSAANLRKCLRGSRVVAAHAHCDRVQDPYSFRCMPQVHGAAKDALACLETSLLTEANSATDNPLVFAGEGDAVSAGNFHGQPIAMTMDHGVNALCAWANISERRVSTLLHPAMSGLPAFLTPEPGLNSGLMIPQVVAAALCSENKVLAHPASTDTVTTSADQEDHVSMAMHAARKLRQAVMNTERVLAIELVTAAQAREFHRELRAGKGAEAAYECLRGAVAPLREDRYLAPDLDRAHALVRTGAILAAAEQAVGALEA
ncbi:MAG: histidine ammonia-lyase [Planctomycetota bacterium]|nr:MAG: histidine ammonia-lyase [Planctomycetota bacterium]